MTKNTIFTGVSLVALAGSALAAGPGPKPVDLRSAGDFVILTKSGITNVPTSAVTGDVGTSPITGAADLLTCTEVDGSVFSVNAAGPDPCSIKDPTKLTVAVLDMETAYMDAAGRKDPDFIELGGGDIGGLTLDPGLYKWSTNLQIPTDVTLSGSEDDVWIFQIAGNLKESDGIGIHLIGGAQSKNVFWQVAGQVDIGTTAHLQGIVLSKTLIAMKTGAWVNGRLFSQTAVTLEMNKVKKP